jgi:hypothetical protein
MATHVENSRDSEVLAQIKNAMQRNSVKIEIVRSFHLTTGKSLTGAQVIVNVNGQPTKVGPTIFPGEAQTLGDVLKMLGDMA